MFIFFFLLLNLNIFLIKNISQDDLICKKSDINKEIEIGDEVTLCLHSKEQKLKIASKLKVDEYSIVTIEGGFSKLATEDTQGATTVLRNNEQNPEINKYRRRMVIEPEENNNNKYFANNPNSITTNIVNTHHIIETTTRTTMQPTPTQTSLNSVTPTQTPEEEEINPDDKSQIIAQIGDKFTQYPSVIFYINLFIFIIYRYIIVHLVVIIKRYLPYLVLL